MKISPRKLAKLEDYYSGYLEGEKLDEFLRDFDIKFACGHWAAGDFLDRFATQGYWPNLDSSLEAQLERIAKAGVKGVELQDFLFLDKDMRVREDTVSRFRELLERYGLTPTTMGLNLYTNPMWKMGSVTNPKREVREKALEMLLNAVDLAKTIGCETVSFWPGQDGWDYNFEANYGKQ
ncbi:MAG TPA: sugar isomerase, partial [Candidatus Bathyarchaeota archaeon]|nr:sugar isomerase [Candidatus Bathyarchaeota archaeon]